MERRLQQQTLSIRISDALRDFLERSKEVLSRGRGELVSTSDIAKILLESAKDGRLDFRLEVAELQQNPTQALWAIRRKWEMRQPLSRAEWIFVSSYIEIACEQLSENPDLPGPESFIALLEALLAVRSLRADRGGSLDRYYLGNFGFADAPTFNDRQLDTEAVPETVDSLIEQLRQAPRAKPVFAGRNFYVALRDERLDDVIALNRVLEPYMPTLLRLAARGHWIREGKPVRGYQDGVVFSIQVPAVTGEGFRFSVEVGTDGELVLLFSMDKKDVMYPIEPYPVIREFASMLEKFKPGFTWHGRHFHGFTVDETPEEPVRFYFRRHRDGVTLGFSLEEWQGLKRLLMQVLNLPKLQSVLSELSLCYGEV